VFFPFRSSLIYVQVFFCRTLFTNAWTVAIEVREFVAIILEQPSFFECIQVSFFFPLSRTSYLSGCRTLLTNVWTILALDKCVELIATIEVNEFVAIVRGRCQQKTLNKRHSTKDKSPSTKDIFPEPSPLSR